MLCQSDCPIKVGEMLYFIMIQMFTLRWIVVSCWELYELANWEFEWQCSDL